MKKTKNAIIVPTLNEEDNIEPLLKGIYSHEIDFQVIFVDDNSKDRTREIINKFKRKNKLIHLIERPKKMGIGTAQIAGMKYAIENLDCELIFTMDADLSHDPNDLPKFFEKINEGADVVIGSRYFKGGKIIGWGFYRKLKSRIANSLARIVLGLKTRDVTTGYRGYKRKVLEKIDYKNIKSKGYSALQELLYLSKRKKFRIEEFPVILIDRIEGESKLTSKEVLSFLKNLFSLKIKTIKKEI
ncbi:MAG: polyprenol monophosphomannose synthase [Candidatus Diapherotrites archaeon]